MAIVKFVTAGCPMSNIFKYIMRDEATERKLIDGIDCMPESAEDEFKSVKAQFHKEDGRQYYHIMQSFSPDDDITPEEAHEIGMEFAAYFPGFQMVVATHVNKAHLHNHIIMNSVSYENGRKFHQSRDEMLAAKRYSNEICRRHGLSVTEEKCEFGRMPRWKKQLRSILDYALQKSRTREEFIEWLRNHGVGVRWDNTRTDVRAHKYITFSIEGDNGTVYKARDNKLFDERFLKSNLEAYFALGGCRSYIASGYYDYKTPTYKPNMNMTVTAGLVRLITDALTIAPPPESYTPRRITEHDWQQIEALEEILGRKISPDAFICYADDDKEPKQYQGLYL